MDFTGFGDEAFEFFEQVQANASWPAVQQLHDSWERHVPGDRSPGL